MIGGETITPYPLSNTAQLAHRHHALLAQMCDPFSQERIMDLVDLPSARVLDVGAGGGSLAVWMAQQVGPCGAVLACDKHPLDIPSHPQLGVFVHQLPQSLSATSNDRYHLVHARLVLNHLPERADILLDLANMLRPGGVLLLEDWHVPNSSIVLDAPTIEVRRLIERVQEAISATFTAAGTDRWWARKVPAAMRAARLVEVETKTRAESWPGGSGGALLMAAVIEQLRDRLLLRGLSDGELTEAHEYLSHDADLVILGHAMWSTSGQVRS